MPYSSREGSGRRPSLNLMRLFGGSGVEGGTFDELPSVDIQQDQGPTLTGEPLRPRVKFNPGKYTPAKAKGWMNPEGEAQAAQMNFQGGSNLANIAAQFAEQQARAEEAYALQGMTNANTLANTKMSGENALALQRGGVDAAFLLGHKAPYSLLSNLTQSVSPHIPVQAENEARNTAEFSGSPEGKDAQRDAYIEGLRAQGAENYSKTAKVIGLNDTLYNPRPAPTVGTTVSGATSKQTVEPTTKNITLPDGTVIQQEGPPKVLTETVPGGAIKERVSPEETKRRERLRFKSIEGMPQRPQPFVPQSPFFEGATNASELPPMQAPQAKPNLGTGGGQTNIPPFQTGMAGEPTMDMLKHLLRKLVEMAPGSSF